MQTPRHRAYRRNLAFVLLCLAAIPAVTRGQASASAWEGIVRDQNRAAVQDAVVKVIVKGGNTSARQFRQTTDSSGAFNFGNLSPGDYTIALEWQGRTAVVNGVLHLKEGEHSRARLEISADQTQVTLRTYLAPGSGPGQTADLTSAHDLAVLGRELLRFPEVMQWAGTQSAGFRGGALQMTNTNHLIGSYPGATGLKTGFYREAGFSVTATATRNDMNVIAVVLGVPTKAGCFGEAARLMNEAFANYRMLVAARRGAVVSEVPVASGDGDSVKAIATDDLRLLVKRSDDKGVAVEARIPRLLQAPVRREQPLGEVVVHRGDQELGRVSVVADRDVAATGWLSWFWNRRN